jgi:hypothetical protein
MGSVPVSTQNSGSVPVPTPKPVSVENVLPAEAEIPTVLSNEKDISENAEENETFKNILTILASVIGVGALFAGIANLLKKKTKNENEDDCGCFNLKKLMEDKLKELTDIRGRIENKVKNEAKILVKESVKGTATGDVLVALEKAEKEYSRLKKLYEECVLDLDKNIFKGTIVENSLVDKSILEKVKIKETRQEEGWTIHDVFVSKDQVSEMAKHLANGPWYIHFWKRGTDDVKVIFKNKVFDIKHGDKTTWNDAVSYGKSIGIREDQLDFKIDQ